MRWTAPNFGIRNVILPVLALLMLAGAVAMVLSREPQPAAAADGPCGTSHDGLSSEESEFIDLLEGWRAARHLQSSALESSAPLNAAAAWFAQHLVEEGVAGPTGHHDHYGRIWLERAIDCGYNAYYAQGSGEGVGLFGSSALDPETMDAADGLALVDYPGSGININAGGSIPAKCVGVGVYRDEHTIAWIVIIAQWQVDLPCPQTVTAEQPSPNPSPSVSVSPTSTFTPSPTPTATPTPIPEWNAYAPNVASDR